MSTPVRSTTTTALSTTGRNRSMAGTDFCGRGVDGIEGRSDLLDHRTDLVEHRFPLGQRGFGFFHEPGGLGLHLPGEAKQSDHSTGLDHEGQASDQHRYRIRKVSSDIHDKVPRLRVLAYRVVIG